MAITTSTHASGGWIKIYRQALQNGWLRNHKLWAFWCYCLLKASHQDTKVMIGYQQVPLRAGQFVFGRKLAAEDLGMSEQTIRTCINRLVLLKNITIKATNKFSVITVENWGIYQDCTESINQQDNKPVTNNQPTTNHIQEVKEVKNKPSSPESLHLSGLLADLILQNNPNHSKLSNGGKSKTVTQWATDIEKLIRIDKQEPDTVEKVICWSQSDPFWRSNILSGATLRKQWNKLTVKMESAKQPAKGDDDLFKGVR